MKIMEKLYEGLYAFLGVSRKIFIAAKNVTNDCSRKIKLKFYVLHTFPLSLTVFEIVKQRIFLKSRGNNRAKAPELVLMPT
jgi:hypothetical protein